MSLNLTELLFDATDSSGPKVGSYLISKSGEIIDHADVGGVKGLNVNVLNDIEVALDHVNDSVRLGDGTNLTVVTADGELKVIDEDANAKLLAIRTSIELLDNAMDGNAFAVNVKEDLPLEFAVDSVTAYQGGTWNVNQAVPSTSIANAATSVTTTATALPNTANRKRVFIQNLGSKDMFIGGASVSVANGIKIPKGGTFNEEMGAIQIYGIVASGTTDARSFEVV